MSAFFHGWHFPIPLLAVVAIVAMAWSGLAFGAKIHEAAQNGSVEKLKALLQDHPDVVFIRDKEGRTPLRIAAGEGRKDVDRSYDCSRRRQ
jgi:hypothetical protein